MIIISTNEPYKEIVFFVLRLESLNQAKILPAGTGVLIHYGTGKRYRSIFPVLAHRATSIRELRLIEIQKYCAELKSRGLPRPRWSGSLSLESELTYEWIERYHLSMHMGTHITQIEAVITDED